MYSLSRSGRFNLNELPVPIGQDAIIFLKVKLYPKPN
jgi:hypothetical protein